MRHRRDTHARGRHRAEGLPRYRAPRTPIVTDRGRSTAVAAALVAGVGIAGISAAAAGASPSVDAANAALNAQAAQPAAQPPPARTAAPQPSVEIVAATPTAAPTATPTPDAPAARQRFAGAAAKVRAAKVRTTAKPTPPPVWVNPMAQGSVTSCYGPRWGRLHAGVDLAAPSGTPILAAGAGTVVQAGAWAGGYGISVLIDPGNGYLTHYGHLSVTVVEPGQVLHAGQEIGLEGSTGHSTGPHLHFEVHEGAWKNQIEPTAWLLAHGVDVGGCATAPSAGRRG